jgi:hypothetical protein
LRYLDSPGEPLPINIEPVPINKVTPTDTKIQGAAQELSNRQVSGALGMHAKEVKQWLHRIRHEEDLSLR